MKKHTKIYIDHFNYCEQDFVPCEMCGTKAVDVHHIEPRGMGGSKTKDYIENLVGLCRQCHLKAEKSKEFNVKVKNIHLKNLKKHEQGNY